MSFKKIINQLPVTLPISLLAFLFSDLMMENVVGGFSLSLGLPLPYWCCVFMPDLTSSGDGSYFSPLFLAIDVILFILITDLIYNSFGKKKINIKKLNKLPLFILAMFNIFVLYYFFKHVISISLMPIC